ncbi:MAG: NAD(P)H-dependent flavin oxidoreductase [Burkholderiaceae bacterium]
MSQFNTRITTLLGIKNPILCGGLMWLSEANYVAASARAGCIGFLTSRSFESPARLREEIRKCRDLADGFPIGVNFSVSKRDRNDKDLRERIEIALSEGVQAFETAGHTPEPVLGPVQAAGGVVIHKSASVRHALKAEALGADAVAIVGHEEGGHPGMNELSTMFLATLAARQIKVPVVMGGGIGTGEQIVGLLALGIDAVVMGSRFLVAEEIATHHNYKQGMIAAGEHDTVAVLKSLGTTWRVLRNETSRQVMALEAEGVDTYAGFGEQLLGTYGREQAYRQGNYQQGMLSVGPAVCFANQIEPVGTIVNSLLLEAQRAVDRLKRLAPEA